MRNRISVIDAVLAEGEPVVFKEARLGDKQSIANIFEKTYECKYGEGESVFKSFIGLGAVVVDFLITKLKSEQDGKAPKVNAIRALGEIGDVRALEPLIEAIMTMDADFSDAPLEALYKIGSPGAFAQLLNILERIHTLQSPNLQYTLQFKIVNTLNRILERVAAEIPDNDLIAASEIKDVSVRLFRFIETGEAEDAYGHYTSGYRSEVTDTIDCASLREAAQREIKRRDLVG